MTRPYVEPKRRVMPFQCAFNASAFRKMHGHMPRGEAIWIFYFADALEEPWIPGQRENCILPLSYLAAKAIATQEARRRRVTSIRVDPLPI